MPKTTAPLEKHVKRPGDAKQRKLVSVSYEAYTEISTISEAMNTSRTRVIDALLDFFHDNSGE